MNVDGVNMVVGAEEKFNLLKHLDRLLLISEKTHAKEQYK